MRPLFIFWALWALLIFGGAITAQAQTAPSAPSAPLAASASAPQTPALRLRIVGGLAGVTQYEQHEAPFWTEQLAQRSQGRYRADIVPFDKAGVPGSDMLRMVQLGVIPFGTMLASLLGAQHPILGAPDLPGLSPDMDSLRRTVAAYRPALAQILRQEFDVELLAVYTYPAQMLFCKEPIAQLADLAGRRVRVSGPGQADFIQALGATPVLTSFSQLVASVESGESQCAITGSMSGHTIGLYRHTHYLYPLPITWGLALFGAHRPTWNALPPDLRALLEKELPVLEQAIWQTSLRDTALGLDCNSGAPTCPLAAKGRMKIVPLSAQDEAQVRRVLQSRVLPQWVQRCGRTCVDLWNQTQAAPYDIRLSAP